MRRRQSQPRGKKPRVPVSSAFMEALEKAVQAKMRRFNVSRSFVIATATAYALGVTEQPTYFVAKSRQHWRIAGLRIVRRA